MSRNKEAPATVPEDANAGCGGSYVVDANTGERVLTERTQPANEDQQAKEQEEDGTTQA